MPIGWIDFSKTERSKVMNVLDLLSEKGTLDELGIAPIRDGFANLFFPGTSTVQTRAKYFLITPYILKDLEHSSESNPRTMLNLLDQEEMRCGEILLDREDKEGIIGSRSLRQGKWVKRAPSDIYWAGLRTYGIFTGGGISLSEYISAMCAVKRQKNAISSLGNHNDKSGEKDADDNDAGGLIHMQFWNLPTYEDDWEDSLDMKLTEEEGAFLKEQIIKTCPDSMLAYILKNKKTEILGCENFEDMKSFINSFPEEMRNNYHLAIDFSDFIYTLMIIYNLIVSDEKNELAVSEWKRVQHDLEEIADVDLQRIFDLFSPKVNGLLQRFLLKEKALMSEGDLEGMKKVIRYRERELKQTRAKSLHPGEFDTQDWFGGPKLDYRFSRNAHIVISDIFESEGINVKSE